jgi:hypothetical protein
MVTSDDGANVTSATFFSHLVRSTAWHITYDLITRVRLFGFILIFRLRLSKISRAIQKALLLRASPLYRQNVSIRKCNEPSLQFIPGPMFCCEFSGGVRVPIREASGR